MVALLAACSAGAPTDPPPASSGPLRSTPASSGPASSGPAPSGPVDPRVLEPTSLSSVPGARGPARGRHLSDASDRNLVLDNAVSANTAASVDLKEGTSDGVVAGNTSTAPP